MFPRLQPAWLFVVAAGIILLHVKFSSSEVISPYARSYTATKKNLSCSQCELKDRPKDEFSFVQWRMERRQCEENPEYFFKPCPDDKFRGCGKITVTTDEPVFGGKTRAVKLLKRFCAISGGEEEELECAYREAQGGYSEVCICGSSNCNSANGRSQMSQTAALASFGFLLAARLLKADV